MNDDVTPPSGGDRPASELPPSAPLPPPESGGAPEELGSGWEWRGWGGQPWGAGAPGSPGWGQPWPPALESPPESSGHSWGPPPGGFGPAHGWGNDPWGGYPPHGAAAPPYPPAAYPPYPTGYPPTTPAKPARMAPVAIAVGLVIALTAGVTGAGIGIALRSQPSTSITSPGGGGSAPSSGGPTSPSGGGSSTINSAAIATAMDPSIVDVVNTLSEDNGVAEGTGIILTTSGEILTNNHVIDNASSVTVQIDGQGPQLAAKVLGYDPVDDVALIQVENTTGLSLKVAPLGDSNTVSVGDPVVAIGNAEGRGGTPAVVSGTVTGLDQSITASDGDTSESLTGMIQMNANIVPGDSGGPLVNAAGKVIGMNTAGSQNGDGFGNQVTTQGFAIPIDTADQIAQQIASGHSSGSIQIGGGPLIGVSVIDNAGAGALIQNVVSGSPAAAAGLKAGDVIDSVNGTSISSSADLSSAMRTLHPGQTIQLGWMDSSGQQHTASLTLGTGPPR